MNWQPMINESENYKVLPGAQAEGMIQWLPSVGNNDKAVLRKAGFYKVRELKWRIVNRPRMEANVLVKAEKGKKSGNFVYGIWVYASDPLTIEWSEEIPDIDAFVAPEILKFRICGYTYTGKREERAKFFDEAIHRWRKKHGYE